MNYIEMARRITRQSSTERQLARVRELAEAGANGRALSPVEIREVCEAFRTHQHRAPTHFHSGFGA